MLLIKGLAALYICNAKLHLLENLVIDKNKSILESLKSRKNDIINAIYQECYPTIKYMISSNSGSTSDAQDIFQDALLLVITKARNNNLELTCSIKTYMYSVCFNMWQKQLMRKSREVSLNDSTDIPDHNDLDQKLLEEKLFDIYQLNFNMLSLEYQKILNMYLSRYSMTRITREMGYKNENYAKVKKYMCKEQLKKNILSDPGLRESLYLYTN